MLFRLTDQTPYYELSNPEERIFLRDELEEKGFFKIAGNEQYYSWFEIEVIPLPMFVNLYKAMQLFAYTLVPTTKN